MDKQLGKTREVRAGTAPYAPPNFAAAGVPTSDESPNLSLPIRRKL